MAILSYPYNFSDRDTYISYLPYAHIFEQAVLIASIIIPIKIGYYSGNPLALFEDIALLQPTILVTVPRVLNKIYSKVMDEVSRKSRFIQTMFHRALNTKKENLEARNERSHMWYDIFFKGLKQKLGGRVNCLLVGSAPLDPEISAFF